MAAVAGEYEQTAGTQEQAPETMRRSERIGIALCCALYVLLRVWHLPATLISDKFDEGVYLSLMLGEASGHGVLYRDYMLCHPPGVLWAGIRLWPLVHGSITALRLIYIAFCALTLPPVYAIARRYYGVRPALLTLLLLCTTPGLANWLGRDIYLDPPLNAPIYLAIWLLLGGRQEARRNAIAAGILLGLSYLIKETALPAALALCLALWWAGQEKRKVFCFGAAFAVTLAVTLLALSRIPNYLYYTFTLNANDVRDWSLRLHEAITGFYALPFPLTFGILGVWQMARQQGRPHERLLGAYALTMSLLMLLIPKAFYWRYLTAALPVYCLGVAVWWQRFLAVPRPRLQRRIAFALASLCGLVHLASLILYHTHEAVNPPAYGRALRLLRESPGPLFTLDPIWSAASGLPLTPPVQRLIKVTIHLPVHVDEVERALADCPIVLLDRITLRCLPPTALPIIRSRYRSVLCAGSPGDPRYVEVLIEPTL